MKNALALLIGATFAFSGLTGCCTTAKKNCSAQTQCSAKGSKQCPASEKSCPSKTGCCASKPKTACSN